MADPDALFLHHWVLDLDLNGRDFDVPVERSFDPFVKIALSVSAGEVGEVRQYSLTGERHSHTQEVCCQLVPVCLVIPALRQLQTHTHTHTHTTPERWDSLLTQSPN
jgi:hypothetical protein